MASEGRGERRGLGRGLGALIAEAGTGSARDHVDPASIRPNPYQPRTVFDPVKIAELAESIRVHGVLQPLIVRRAAQGFELVSGERRWRAAQQAGLSEVPVVVRDLSDRDMLEVALVENVQREDINALEAAAAYRRLADEFQLTQEEIARRVGKSRSSVANTMRILNLPDPMQDSLRDGRLTEGHARALLSISDPVVRDRTWRGIISAGASVRAAEQAARESKAAPSADPTAVGPQPARAPASPLVVSDPNLEAVEARVRGRLGTRVAITWTAAGRGQIAIEFYDDDDLDRILDLLGA